MRFTLLGATRAHRDDGAEVALGGPARRALLALLLLEPGRPVPADRLAEESNPRRPPSAHALESQMSRLRSALGDAAPLERSGTGYRIVVPYDTVDAHRFERLAGTGRTSLTSGDWAGAAGVLREALALWQGEAFADLPDSGSARAAAVRLEELRLTALEDRLEADLRLGRHRTAVPELRELTGRCPLRERAAALLIRALSALDGQAAALAAYETTRRHLADELGADPSPELVSVHAELLRQDPTPALARPPAQLTALIGRDREVAEVGALLGRARLVTLTGPGGVGKTRLAVAAATAEPGEVCFVQLAPLGDESAVPGALLTALGLSVGGLHLGADDPSPDDRIVTALAGRALLLVLDNCEHLLSVTATLAARLLAAGPRLRVLVTGREPLGVIGEHLYPVRPLAPEDAARLFAERAAAVRPGPAATAGTDARTAPRTDSHTDSHTAPAPVPVPAPDADADTCADTVRQVCAALDNLPLAVELAAARLRTLHLEDLADLAQRLDDRLGMAARGARTGDGRHRTLRSVVAWSWDLLPEPERRAARRFAVFHAGATPATARTVCGTDPDTLEALADKSLLEHTGGRYRMLETVRAYAAEQLASADQPGTVHRAHTAHLLTLARTADPHLRGPAQLDWLARLGGEHDDLMAAVRRAVEAPEPETALALLAAAAHSLWIRGIPGCAAPHAARLLEIIDGEPPPGYDEEFAVCLLLAVSAGDGKDGEDGEGDGAPGTGQGDGAPGTGRTVWRRHRARAEQAMESVWSGSGQGRHPAALLLWVLRNATDGDAHRAHALVSARRTGPDAWTRAVAHYVTAYGALGENDPERAGHALRTAAETFHALGDRWGGALTLDALATVAAVRGDRAEAVALIDRALALTGRLGALADTADLLVTRGDHLAAADPAAARADFTRAAALARRAGSPAGLAAARRALADLALTAGDTTEAEHLYRTALDHLDPRWVRSIGDRVRALAGLARVAEARGDHDTARRHYRRAAEAAYVPGAPTATVLSALSLPAPAREAIHRA
ncbi:BTAD domain-containing putative transcriptional regulator [Streptomyces sp. NPDC021356]|uniref:BTAD domain-containing putative transcriptional regulator n=1 Tax=Streptomyces sp. NPDC021356 TaxID=3154900 RepID=UPI0033C228D9